MEQRKIYEDIALRTEGDIYIGVVGLMVKWFPQNRGFAAGAVAAGYGMGAILTTFPIAISLGSYGLEQTMTVFGLIFAAVGLLASQGLSLPPSMAAMPASIARRRPPSLRTARPTRRARPDA